MGGGRLGGEQRIAPLVHPIGDLQVVQAGRTRDELPESDSPSPAVGPRAETALDEGHVDEIFGKPGVPEDRPHHRLVPAGA